MAVNTDQVTVGTTATKLVDGSGQPGREENTSKVWVTNGAAVIAIGASSNVTMTNGILLAANATFPGPIQLGAGESLYAICATSSVVSWLQSRV